jgi:hypothetical protein
MARALSEQLSIASLGRHNVPSVGGNPEQKP